MCEKRARVHGGSKSKGANSEEAAEKGRNEINQIATLLENAIWLPKRNPLHNRKERIGERIWRRRQRFGFGCDGLMAAYSPRRPRACAAPAPGWRFAQPDAGSRFRRQPPLFVAAPPRADGRHDSVTLRCPRAVPSSAVS